MPSIQRARSIRTFAASFAYKFKRGAELPYDAEFARLPTKRTRS